MGSRNLVTVYCEFWKKKIEVTENLAEIHCIILLTILGQRQNFLAQDFDHMVAESKKDNMYTD